MGAPIWLTRSPSNCILAYHENKILTELLANSSRVEKARPLEEQTLAWVSFVASFADLSGASTLLGAVGSLTQLAIYNSAVLFLVC